MMRRGVFGAMAALGALAGTVTAAEARPHDFEASTQEIFASYFTNPASWRQSQKSFRQSQKSLRKDRSHRASRSARRQRAHREVPETASYGSYHGAGPRPRRWCGWWMRTQRGGGPHLNVARNWARWGSPASPQVGAVVVWRHHVGEIVGQGANGRWVVRSGNDGGRVRSRARSLAGVIAVRM